MSAQQLLSELQSLGVTLSPSGERLSVSAPAGIITAELKQRMAEHKQALLQLLTSLTGEPFPLTDIQQAYLVGRSEAMPLGGVGCHFYREWEGPAMDLKRLEQAWRQVIRQHPMLRAVISPDGTQRLLDAVPEWRLRIEDSCGDLRSEMAHAQFQPDRWPLFDIRAVLLPDGRQRLHFGFDLLVADAAGIRRLLADWRAFYQHPERVPQPAARTFQDHVLTLRRAEQTPEFAADLKYWTKRLGEMPGPPDLPLARAPEQVRKPRFTRRETTFRREVWAGLQRRAASSGVTPSILICWAFAQVLGRWSRRRAMTLTLTRFEGVRDVVGDFTSTLLLEVNGEGAATLQRRIADDLNHSRVSGVRALREAANRQTAPYGYPVVFTSALGHQAADDPAWLGETKFTLTETPQVWLDHVVLEENGRPALSWDAVDELFPPGLLDDMFSSEVRLLEVLSLEGEPQAWLFSPAQIEERAAWNRTEASIPTGLLHEPFLKHAALQPEALAVIDADRSLTYAELDVQARRLAFYLRSQGVAAGDRVAVMLAKGWQQVVAVLAAGYCGAVYVPLDPGTPEARFRRLLERIDARVVLDAVEYRTSGELLDPSTVVRSELDKAYIIFTSGSTGEPKGVVIDHRGARNTIEDVNARCSVAPGDRVLSLSALHFDLSVYDIFGVLGAGGAVVLPDRTEHADPRHWIDLIARHKVTIWNSVPALFRMVVDALPAGSSALHSLRWVLLSGDWIPPALIDDARPLAPQASFVSMGGATEASIWSIWHDIDDRQSDWPSVPYGRPMRNQTFHVLDADLEPCPVWAPGQLFIGGIGLANGYWRDPERTAAQFLTHPKTGERLYATGDLGRYRPGGVIEFLGREDDQVKVQGFRIELGEIEAAMQRHPQTAAAVAVAKGDAFSPKRLVGYAVPKEAWQPPADASILTDPAERLERRLRLHQEARGDGLALPAPDAGPRVKAIADRRTVRRFAGEPLSQAKLAGLLAALRPGDTDQAGLPRYLYPSAGHLYQVSAYVHCKEGRVEGLAGFYRYAPGSHTLDRVSNSATLPRTWHAAQNQAVFDEAAFSVFLVAALHNVQPFYGARARDFCLLEAGYMSQLLMLAAEDHGLGLCAIGAMDTGAVAQSLGLGDGQEIVHGFVGGVSAGRDSDGGPPDYLTPQGLTPASLHAFLRGELPSYMIPPNIVILDSLPLTANGKVDRSALPNPAQPTSDASDDRVAWLTAIVSELLYGAPVDPHANFFQIGATSLHLVQLTRRLEELGKAISITEIFRNPTVMALAGLLESSQPPASVREDALARGRARRSTRGRAGERE